MNSTERRTRENARSLGSNYSDSRWSALSPVASAQIELREEKKKSIKSHSRRDVSVVSISRHDKTIYSLHTAMLGQCWLSSLSLSLFLSAYTGTHSYLQYRIILYRRDNAKIYMRPLDISSMHPCLKWISRRRRRASNKFLFWETRCISMERVRVS
jgi:hypothetical protein